MVHDPLGHIPGGDMSLFMLGALLLGEIEDEEREREKRETTMRAKASVPRNGKAESPTDARNREPCA